MVKKLILAVIVLFVVAAAAIGFMMWRGLSELNSMEIASIEFGLLSDGDYVGSFGAGPVSAKVNVKVENGRVTQIDILEHNHGQGAQGERVVDLIIEKQSLAVDLVAGATYSSKVILKAVEQALQENTLR